VTDQEQPDHAVDVKRSRRISDSEGRLWVVHEYQSSRYDRRAGTSLIFVTEDAMRRVRDYPANWFELSDDELYALSFRR
jgi:hypothetical protein